MKKTIMIVFLCIMMTTWIFASGCSGDGEDDSGFMSSCGCGDLFSGCGCGGEDETDSSTSEQEVEDSTAYNVRDSSGVTLPDEPTTEDTEEDTTEV